MTDEQRRHLETYVRSGNTPARSQTRARILLLADHSQERFRSDEQVAEILGCHRNTISNVRHRFLKEGIEAALKHKPLPPRAPKKLTGEVEAKIIALACSAPPEGHARWALRLLADKAVELGYVESISHVAIGERLKKTKLSPGK